MTIRLHSVVKTRQALPGALPSGKDLQVGAEGTVVMVHNHPRRAFEVEFCDSEGATLALLPLREEDLELVVP